MRCNAKSDGHIERALYTAHFYVNYSIRKPYDLRIHASLLVTDHQNQVVRGTLLDQSSPESL